MTFSLLCSLILLYILTRIFNRFKAHLVLGPLAVQLVCLTEFLAISCKSEARISLWLHWEDNHCLTSVANLRYLYGQSAQTGAGCRLRVLPAGQNVSAQQGPRAEHSLYLQVVSAVCDVFEARDKWFFI